MPKKTTKKASAASSHLDDQLQLQKLMNTYGWRADKFDWKGWSQTFTEDAIFDLPNSFGLLKGRKQIHDVCKGNMDHIYKDMHHIMVNLDFEITGRNTADGRGNLIFVGVANTAVPTQYVQSGGRYNWKFKRTKAGWRIHRARLDFLWNNGGDKESVFDQSK
jgi:SnoaL-like domain